MSSPSSYFLSFISANASNIDNPYVKYPSLAVGVGGSGAAISLQVYNLHEGFKDLGKGDGGPNNGEEI